MHFLMIKEPCTFVSSCHEQLKRQTASKHEGLKRINAMHVGKL